MRKENAGRKEIRPAGTCGTSDTAGAGLVEGIVQAVAHCHELLLKAGFKAEAGQRNELSDKPMLDGEGA